MFWDIHVYFDETRYNFFLQERISLKTIMKQFPKHKKEKRQKCFSEIRTRHVLGNPLLEMFYKKSVDKNHLETS